MAVTRITPAQSHERLTSEDDLAYLDVRSVREFQQGHPPGAINIPWADHHPVYGQLAPNERFLEAVQGTFSADAKIITGCAAGGRSLKAAQTLESAGYTNVVDMLGGFSGKRMPPTQPGWTDAGLPTATDGETWAQVQARLE